MTARVNYSRKERERDRNREKARQREILKGHVSMCLGMRSGVGECISV